MYIHINFQKEFCNSVIGIIALTDYNNNTYRIEDVDFDTSPSSTFSMKSGESISYQEYYKRKYGIRITNATQPMLVTRTKPKARNAGQGDLVYLVPELCRATGMLCEYFATLLLMHNFFFIYQINIIYVTFLCLDICTGCSRVYPTNCGSIFYKRK